MLVENERCSYPGCLRAGYWIEETAAGPLLCFRVRHDGASHVQRISLADVEQKLKARPNVEDVAAHKRRAA